MEELGDVERLLRKGRWFSQLPRPLQQRVLRRSFVRSFVKGHRFQIEGAQVAGLTAVIAGRVRLCANLANGGQALIHVGGPGFWFGYMGVLLEGQAAVSAVAATPVRVLVFPKMEFKRTVDEHPRAYQSFARLPLEHLAFVIQSLAEERALNPDARVRHRLAALADLRRRETSIINGPVTLDLTQGELAEIVGLSRQKLNPRLRRLREEGLIALDPGRIHVLDPQELRASATPSWRPGTRGQPVRTRASAAG
jgi:CRP/FNR family cyclic AMP-dependent transcriptional regulator